MAEIEIDRTDDWPPRTMVRCKGRTWRLGDPDEAMGWGSTNPGELVAKLFLWLVTYDDQADPDAPILAQFQRYEVT